MEEPNPKAKDLFLVLGCFDDREAEIRRQIGSVADVEAAWRGAFLAPGSLTKLGHAIRAGKEGVERVREIIRDGNKTRERGPGEHVGELGALLGERPMDRSARLVADGA